ncbi:MAG: NAD(P)/FAD-dependent oxidoreductase [Lachnospiraceae bacterium]|nr:NAD(P)/FAD-dependent oxidoreductase [Lachnospiraceae bacterium]
MERYDIAIIGTGPAGLSAAITAKIRNKSVLLLGSRDLSMKIQKAHTIQNYLGLPDVSGEELADAFSKHLEQQEISITEDKVSAVYAMGDYFSIMAAKENYEASTLILATGIPTGKTYPGEEKFLGRGVSYCATCDAPLYKGKKAVIVGFSPKEEAEAEFMAEIADEVLYIPMYPDEVQLSEKIKMVRETPVAVEGIKQAERLVTNANTYETDGIFFLRESVSPGQLVPGLELEERHVKVTRRMETNISGCFACGDIVGTPYQYIKSAGEGNVAVLSAVSYLDQKKRK